jgi:hypothetical protein
LEHLERIARTGESESHKVVFGGNCKISFENGEMMIEQSKAQKILEQLGGDGTHETYVSFLSRTQTRGLIAKS